MEMLKEFISIMAKQFMKTKTADMCNHTKTIRNEFSKTITKHRCGREKGHSGKCHCRYGRCENWRCYIRWMHKK